MHNINKAFYLGDKQCYLEHSFDLVALISVAIYICVALTNKLAAFTDLAE